MPAVFFTVVLLMGSLPAFAVSCDTQQAKDEAESFLKRKFGSFEQVYLNGPEVIIGGDQSISYEFKYSAVGKDSRLTDDSINFDYGRSGVISIKECVPQLSATNSLKDL